MTHHLCFLFKIFLDRLWCRTNLTSEFLAGSPVEKYSDVYLIRAKDVWVISKLLNKLMKSTFPEMDNFDKITLKSTSGE